MESTASAPKRMGSLSFRSWEPVLAHCVGLVISPNAESLLRVLLLHVANGYSLAETAARAGRLGMELSAVAVFKPCGLPKNGCAGSRSSEVRKPPAWRDSDSKSFPCSQAPAGWIFFR